MSEMTFIYFAYGSNMLAEWLSTRCPSARQLGIATAPEFSLSFSKRSKDGSAKATLLRSEATEHGAYGVLFEVAQIERGKLDSAEGKDKGYGRDDAFRVVNLADGRKMKASTYLAHRRALVSDLFPYDWYRALVVAGALQHQLPERYIKELRGVVIQKDPKPERKLRQQALYVLKNAGFNKLLED